MFRFIFMLWKHRNTPTVVHWDTTDRLYSTRGPRQEGSFVAPSLVRAWFWGQRHTFANPRGAAFLQLSPFNNL